LRPLDVIPRIIGSLCVFGYLFLALSVQADVRSDYLIRLLKGSSQFRVRAQAAISLSRVQADPSVIEALSEALQDDHPAVRAAAASSLESLGDPSAINALQKASNDPEMAVKEAIRRALAVLKRTASKSTGGTNTTEATEIRIPSGPPKYYVGVGLPGGKDSSLNYNHLSTVRAYIEERIKEIDGVLLAPEEEKPQVAKRIIKQKGLTGYYLDSSIMSIEQRADGSTRAVVSVIVGTYPGRDMRVILQGAATVMGNDSESKTQAILYAFKGALRRLPQALEAGKR